MWGWSYTLQYRDRTLVAEYSATRVKSWIALRESSHALEGGVYGRTADGGCSLLTVAIGFTGPTPSLRLLALPAITTTTPTARGLSRRLV